MKTKIEEALVLLFESKLKIYTKKTLQVWRELLIEKYDHNIIKTGIRHFIYSTDNCNSVVDIMIICDEIEFNEKERLNCDKEKK